MSEIKLKNSHIDFDYVFNLIEGVELLYNLRYMEEDGIEYICFLNQDDDEDILSKIPFDLFGKVYDFINSHKNINNSHNKKPLNNKEELREEIFFPQITESSNAVGNTGKKVNKQEEYENNLNSIPSDVVPFQSFSLNKEKNNDEVKSNLVNINNDSEKLSKDQILNERKNAAAKAKSGLVKKID